MSNIILEEQAAPANPGANQVVVYPKSDGLLYWKDDAGVERGVADLVAAQAAAQAVDYRPNMLINGNWLIDQINAGALYTITGGGADVLTVDGWSGSAPVAPGVFKVRRLADPDNAALKCLEITCTTIDATIAAADAYYLHTAIEGQDAASLMAGTALAQQITVSFNFKSNVTGVYGISLGNSALNRSYVGSFTVADASEHSYFVTLTLDTAGTWLYDTGVGLRLRLCLAAGTNFQKAAGTWGADNMLTTSAQCNFMSSVANIAYLKRIQLVPASIASPFMPPDYQKELAKCQRYFFKTFSQGTAVGTGVGSGTGEVRFQSINAGAVAGQTAAFRYLVPMRATPTFTMYNPISANAQARDYSTSADCTLSSISGSEGAFNISVTGAAGSAVNSSLGVHITANARLS